MFDTPPGSEWCDRTYMPAPQVVGIAAPMQGFSESIVSVFMPFQGQDAPVLKSAISGPVASENPQGAAGRLVLDWADGSRDELAWVDTLAFPLFRVEAGTESCETDACVLHVHRDADGTLQAGTALDGSYCRFEQAADNAAAERIAMVEGTVKN